MANTQFSTTGRNGLLSGGLLTLLAAGKFGIYAGVQPATGDTALSGDTLLGTFTLGSPAAGAPASGVLTMNSITGVTAVADGIANFIRQFETDGTTALYDTNICNQTVTLSAAASASDTSLTVSALAANLYAGQDLWFVDATSGVLKKASVTANASAGATSVTVSALAAAIANGSASSAGVTVNTPSITSGLNLSISAYTVTAPAAGS